MKRKIICLMLCVLLCSALTAAAETIRLSETSHRIDISEIGRVQLHLKLHNDLDSDADIKAIKKP